MIIIVEHGFTCARSLRNAQGEETRHFPYALRAHLPRRLRSHHLETAERRYETLEHVVNALVAIGVPRDTAYHHTCLARNWNRNEMLRVLPWTPRPDLHPSLFRHLAQPTCQRELADYRIAARTNPCLHCDTNGDCTLARRLCTGNPACHDYRKDHRP